MTIVHLNEGRVVGKSFLTDNSAGELGILCDEVDAGLQISGDVLHRVESAPGNNFLHTARTIDRFLNRLVPALPVGDGDMPGNRMIRSEEHTSELESLMRISYAVFCLKKTTQR